MCSPCHKLTTISSVRKVIYRQFSEYNTRSGKELAVWSNLNVRDDIRSVKNLLARGTFGFVKSGIASERWLSLIDRPVMPGDSYSSRRLFSLIFAGTIPVGRGSLGVQP